MGTRLNYSEKMQRHVWEYQYDDFNRLNSVPNVKRGDGSITLSEEKLVLN